MMKLNNPHKAFQFNRVAVKMSKTKQYTICEDEFINLLIEHNDYMHKMETEYNAELEYRAMLANVDKDLLPRISSNHKESWTSLFIGTRVQKYCTQIKDVSFNENELIENSLRKLNALKEKHFGRDFDRV